MPEPEVVASRYAPTPDRRQLWKAAIKWPMYAVAVMPVLLAAGWRLGHQQPVRLDQLLVFLLAAILLLAWENLANDVFDADTGVDVTGKPHSVVNLTGRRDRVAHLANGCLLLGLALMVLVAVVVLTREDRVRDHAVLRALGADSRVLFRLQWAELVGTGALAGTLAAVLALAVAWALAREVFDFSWHLPWWSVPLGGLLAAATAVGVGQLTLRGVLRQSVTQTLMQSET